MAKYHITTNSFNLKAGGHCVCEFKLASLFEIRDLNQDLIFHTKKILNLFQPDAPCHWDLSLDVPQSSLWATTNQTRWASTASNHIVSCYNTKNIPYSNVYRSNFQYFPQRTRSPQDCLPTRTPFRFAKDTNRMSNKKWVRALCVMKNMRYCYLFLLQWNIIYLQCPLIQWLTCNSQLQEHHYNSSDPPSYSSLPTQTHPPR